MAWKIVRGEYICSCVFIKEILFIWDVFMEAYIDEAGRGPLAGPLYVGIVVPLKKFDTKEFKDSKMLTEKKREELYQQILELERQWKILFASWNVTHTIIDRKWLTKAINFAIRKAITKLAWHDVFQCSKRTKLALQELWVSALIIDGKHDFNLGKDLDIMTETIVHGDASNPYISMASIIAKVERDHVMLKMAKRYPLYKFEDNKWYGTEFHRKMIKLHGPCKIHRKIFIENKDWADA